MQGYVWLAATCCIDHYRQCEGTVWSSSQAGWALSSQTSWTGSAHTLHAECNGLAGGGVGHCGVLSVVGPDERREVLDSIYSEYLKTQLPVQKRKLK